MSTIVTSPSNIATDVATVDQREHELRLRLWHTLARRVPLNMRFITHLELGEWAERALTHYGITALMGHNQDRLAVVVDDMWRTILLLEQDPPSKHLIEYMGHGPVLYDAWRRAWRLYRRHRAREVA